MELKTAIEILEHHQEWRLGKRDDMIHEPKALAEALDRVLEEVKKVTVVSPVVLSDLIPMLHHLSDCIDEAIANNEDKDKISDVVELLKGIADDNEVMIRD